MDQKIDIISNLNLEIAQNVFYYLDSDSIFKVEKVCKRWKKIFHNSYIWNRNLKKLGVTVSALVSVKETKQETTKSCLKLLDEVTLANDVKLTQNWIQKSLKEVVSDRLNFSDSRIIEYADDEVIIAYKIIGQDADDYNIIRYRVYNKSSKKLIDSFNVIDSTILARKENFVLISSEKTVEIDNEMIRIEKLMVRDIKKRTFLWIRNFPRAATGDDRLHYTRITYKEVYEDVIATTVHDSNMISIIDFHSGNIIRNLRNSCEVIFIKFCKDKLISLTENDKNTKIKVWNVRSGALIYGLQLGCRKLETNFSWGYALLEVKNSYLIASSENHNYIYVWNIKKKKMQYTLKLKHYFESTLCTENSRLICTTRTNSQINNIIHIIDLKSGNLLFTIDTEEPFGHVVTTNSRFVTFSTKYNIMIFDLRGCGKLKRIIPLRELSKSIRDLDDIYSLKTTETSLMLEWTHGNYQDQQILLDFNII